MKSKIEFLVALGISSVIVFSLVLSPGTGQAPASNISKSKSRNHDLSGILANYGKTRDAGKKQQIIEAILNADPQFTKKTGLRLNFSEAAAADCGSLRNDVAIADQKIHELLQTDPENINEIVQWINTLHFAQKQLLDNGCTGNGALLSQDACVGLVNDFRGQVSRYQSLVVQYKNAIASGASQAVLNNLGTQILSVINDAGRTLQQAMDGGCTRFYNADGQFIGGGGGNKSWFISPAQQNNPFDSFRFEACISGLLPADHCDDFAT